MPQRLLLVNAVHVATVFLAGALLVLLLHQSRLDPLQSSNGRSEGSEQQAGGEGELRGAADEPRLVPSAPFEDAELREKERAVRQAAADAVLELAAGVPRSPPFAGPVDTLVVYVLREDDPLHAANYRHFLLTGVHAGSRARTVVLVQERSLKSSELPSSPEVQYVFYGGPCLSELSMLAWLLRDSGQLDWTGYAYFVLLSSAVRGPFLPAYLQRRMHWTQPFISRLRGRVRMVGPRILCGDVPPPPGTGAPARRNPRLPASALALDRAGLELLLGAGNVTACHTSPEAAAYHGEAGAAAALLEAGHGIDCLMLRYQGVHWSHESAWGCNRGLDPAGPGQLAHDGTSLDPMEVLFVPLNSQLLLDASPMAAKAAKLSEWTAAAAAAALRVPHNASARVLANDFVARKGLYKLPRILTCMARGLRCFDSHFFITHNRDVFPASLDLAVPSNHELAWKIFAYIGQFEDRPFRYTCDANWSAFASPAF